MVFRMCTQTLHRPALSMVLDTGMHDTAKKATAWFHRVGFFYWSRHPTEAVCVFHAWAMAAKVKTRFSRRQVGFENGQALDWFELQGWATRLYSTGPMTMRCTRKKTYPWSSLVTNWYRAPKNRGALPPTSAYPEVN